MYKVADATLTPEGVGTRAHLAAKMLVFTEDVAIEYVEFVPDQRIVFEAHPTVTIAGRQLGTEIFSWIWTFAPAGEGTTLTLIVVNQGGVLWERVLDRVAEKGFSKQVRDRLARIKASAEEQAATVLKKAGLGVVALMGLLAVLSAGMVLILRYQPKPLLNATRTVFGRVLNPVWMWLSDRFKLDTAVVHHIGRKSGRKYATPLCMVSTPEGFIVPAACGPATDWLANLKATPESEVVYNRVTHPTVAEVIDLEQAIRYAGGTPVCDCWTQFRVEELVLLRPIAQRTKQPDTTEAQRRLPAQGKLRID